MFNKDSNSTGYKIYHRRKELKMSKLDLMRQVGISKNTLTRYERGITYPKPDTLAKIADALGLELSHFF